MWSACTGEMRILSSRSMRFSTAAMRRSVSLLPRPASIIMLLRVVSRQVMLPLLADLSNANLFRNEKFLRKLLHILAAHALDRGEDFVQGEESAEVHLLTGQVGHARAGGFERKHQGTLQVVFGAAQLFRTDRFLPKAA